MISASGLNFIKGFEAFKPQVYSDVGGYPTIGYGHKLRSGESFAQGVTRDEALQILAQDVGIAEGDVARCVTVPLSQAQLDALISYAFNWGGTNFCRSVMLRRLNSGDYIGAAARIREYPITSKGKVSNGLIRRRAAEADMFLSGTGDEQQTVTPDLTTPAEAEPDVPIDDSGASDTFGLDSSMLGIVAVAAGVIILYLLVSD